MHASTNLERFLSGESLTDDELIELYQMVDTMAKLSQDLGIWFFTSECAAATIREKITIALRGRGIVR